MMTLVSKLLLAYLLGSISGSMLMGRLKRVDIRTMGSGNAGGTNAFRTQGPVFALGVVIVDIGKAVIATALLPGLALWSGPDTITQHQTALACGFASILGHCYPAYHGFRGGKGAATTVGALAVLQPWLLIPMMATWLVVLTLSGYVGLATVLAGFSLVPAAVYLQSGTGLLVFALVVALFMTFTHRANLGRLRRGTENRFEKAIVTNWFRR